MGKGNVTVNTTEHVLSALYALGVDNCLIQVSGPEMPIMDGSALPFVHAIESVGLEKQDAQRNWFVLKEPIWFETQERGTEMLGVPTPGGEFPLTVMVDYNSPVLGTQVWRGKGLSKIHNYSHGACGKLTCKMGIGAR